MLHVDIPSRDELKALAAVRGGPCVSIYLPTHPVTQHTDIDRLELRRLAEEAVAQLRRSETLSAHAGAIEAELVRLREDHEFWRFQSTSLAVLLTAGQIRTFRLPSRLKPSVEVSDRFHLKPMVRAISFADAGFVLAFSRNAARLIACLPDAPAEEIAVDGLPEGVSDVLAQASGRTPTASARAGGEGQKVNAAKFAREVDRALHPVLNERREPLILAATVEMAAIYREANSYPNLAGEMLPGNAEHMSAREIAEAARPIIRGFAEARIAALRERFVEARGTGRATSDLAHIARAATAGAIETLMVDIDGSHPGRIDEAGAIVEEAEAGAGSYDLADELLDRTMASGGAAVGVRRQDLPDPASPAAALLRYPF